MTAFNTPHPTKPKSHTLTITSALFCKLSSIQKMGLETNGNTFSSFSSVTLTAGRTQEFYTWKSYVI